VRRDVPTHEAAARPPVLQRPAGGCRISPPAGGDPLSGRA